jgi:hypothetical protein
MASAHWAAMKPVLRRIIAFGVVAAAALAPGAVRAADVPETALAGLHRAAPALDTNVLALALRAVGCAHRADHFALPRTLTVIDYSLPSTQERLWVLDLEQRSLVYEELVAAAERTRRRASRISRAVTNRASGSSSRSRRTRESTASRCA